MNTNKFVGTSTYSVVGACIEPEPKIFFGETYDEVANKISDELISDFWSECYQESIKLVIQSINNGGEALEDIKSRSDEVTSATPFDIEDVLSLDILSGEYSNSDIQQLAKNMTSIHSVKDEIFCVLTDEFDDIEGLHSIESIPSPELYPVSVLKGDGVTILKGLFFAEMKLLVGEYTDIYEVMFGASSCDEFDSILRDVQSFEYAIAHNHGREVDCMGSLVAFYATLALKEGALTDKHATIFERSAR